MASEGDELNITIAFIALSDGTKAVLRGLPDWVGKHFKDARKKAHGGDILFSVAREVNSLNDEEHLWQAFVLVSEGLNLEILCEKKHQIWRRKATWLWGNPIDRENVCIFMENLDDMILMVEKTETETKKEKTQ